MLWEQLDRLVTAALINSGETILEKIIAEAPQLLENMPDDVVLLPETHSVGQQPPTDITEDHYRHYLQVTLC